MDIETRDAFQAVLCDILAALANCATRLQRLEKIAEYYVMYMTDEGRQFIMTYGDRLREILNDRIATYRVQFSQDYARTKAEKEAEDWLLNVLTEIERGAARGAAPTTPPLTASGADASGADASGIAPTAINNYIITLPPPLTIINTQPNIIIEPINQTILQL